MREITSGVVEDCMNFAKGECKYGAECTRNHHEKLDPGLPDTKRTPDYKVSDAEGEACTRCLQTARPCDKKGRGGFDDPCSECRWFGGDNCQCQIANASLNDTLWHQMLQSRKNDYSLSESRARDAANRMGVVPKAMPDSRLIRGWTGETKEQLLAKPDSMLPDYVRRLPRAYLHPPGGLSLRVRKNDAYYKAGDNTQTGGKRKRVDDVGAPHLTSGPSTMISHLPTFPPAPSRLAADPVAGEPQTLSYSFAAREWTLTYANGYSVSGPPSAMKAADSYSFAGPPSGTASNDLPKWASKHAAREPVHARPSKKPRGGSSMTTPTPSRHQAAAPQPDPLSMEIDTTITADYIGSANDEDIENDSDRPQSEDGK